VAEVVSIFGGSAREGGGGAGAEEMAAFPLNDLGNAMRFILLAGGAVERSGRVDSTDSRILYLLGIGWIGFNGVHWDAKFGEDLARRLGHKVSGELGGLWDFVKDRVPAKDFWKFVNDSGSSGKTTAMMRQAQSYLTVQIDAFDRDPLALTCLNGTLKMRLAPAGEGDGEDDQGRFRVRLEPHSPADRITRCADVVYDPRAEAPQFLNTVETSLGDPAERAYFQRVLGYGSTGRTEEQAFFLCQGRGRDGKSTILDACRETLGTYGLAVAPATFLEGGIRGGGDASPDLIALSGDTRLAVLSEPPRGSKLNEGLLKAWTSGSPISARDLHSKPINFRPKAKLVWECNSFPVARGDDDGIWRRIMPSLFRRQVPKDEIDRLLPDKLRAEFSGILNWLLAGVGDWLTLGGLNPPDSLQQALEDYRRASSPFGDWLSECCLTGDEAKGSRELVGDLYRSFKEWSEAQGNDRIMSAKAFGDALRDRQVALLGKNAKGLKYRGPIRLKTDLELQQDAAASDLDPVSVGDAFGADLDDGWVG